MKKKLLKKVFPIVKLSFLNDVGECPICGAQPTCVSCNKDTLRIEEKVGFACGFEMRYYDGSRRITIECGHLKDVMQELIQEGLSTEELLTSDSSLHRSLGKVRHQEAQRDAARNEKIERIERQKKEKDYFTRSNFFNFNQ